MNTIDLHVHSNISDGTYTPSQLVAYALQKKLRAMALTDHDSTDGLAEAFAAAEGTGLELVPGIEFSTEYQGNDIHIVGLDIDFKDPEFAQSLCRFRNSRDIRNQKMIQKLQEADVDISMEQMTSLFGSAVLTRAHFARYLAEHGYVADMPEAFRKYIGEGCPCFVPREKVTPLQAVHLIYRTGGIAVLAHPMLYHLSGNAMDTLLVSLKKAGLVGIEALYSTHSRWEENQVRLLAKRHDLAISGGSDFHGSNKPKIDLGSGRGNLNIPYDILRNLRHRRNER
ncbi:MAG: PHP domain-containing protein [Eubacteriales bacterium]|nr:PHP domain-containing protein [Eubacteriales bacterium]